MPRDGSATRERILDAAERLVLDYGFGATSVESVIAASQSSKGAFFHHFASKSELARALVERVVTKDHEQLLAALDSVADEGDPVDRLLGFLAWFEDRAHELGSDQADCLYISVLTERQLVDEGTSDQIVAVIEAWRKSIAALVQDALAARGLAGTFDEDALADHVFVTFEGSYLLSRATRDPRHVGIQLGVVRSLLSAVLGRSAGPIGPAEHPATGRTQ